MPDIRDELSGALSHEDPVRRAQIQMLKPLPKRFYKDVSIGTSEDGGHSVLLDGRPVRTPAKNLLAVPTLKLAEMLAAEWDAQVEVIDPAKMPVTRIANTALDGVAKDQRSVFEDILRFAGTDLLCYRASSPEGLVGRQNAVWNPVLEWAAQSLGARFILAEGVIHQEQPGEAITAYAEGLRAFATPLGLTCVHTITTLTGSALLAVAFASGRLTAEQAWIAAHVDEDWQIEHWGTDEEAFKRREGRWQEMQAATAVLDALR
ncbi:MULTISPECIES: ATP12 family chaperone protein [Ensifer]|jgi:chaperone required for assembly of F1-ATPase|uniref:ATP12 family chaperone protein n=1 Tax=Ensifer TaxID=106591 RepID=UPI00042EEDB5|nr:MULTISPECIES: ATP12 family chaperone protein [Ensifer]AHK44127.1 putative chaperone protein [Ensifer adhaerens OV14]MDP9629818.1 chaperone required for assembly of F1-ATPase [Ensifer adhaerens]MBD9486407.1 ATPase [Ensifer sp. ENS11]NOV14740.1 ATPase [Ensifer canadensis]OMQ32009.1 ATPase [Ensifer sp. 1H6]